MVTRRSSRFRSGPSGSSSTRRARRADANASSSARARANARRGRGRTRRRRGGRADSESPALLAGPRERERREIGSMLASVRRGVAAKGAYARRGRKPTPRRRVASIRSASRSRLRVPLGIITWHPAAGPRPALDNGTATRQRSRGASGVATSPNAQAHFVAFKGFRERLHGHNYTVGVRVFGPLSEGDGYVLDFGDVKKAPRPAPNSFGPAPRCTNRSRDASKGRSRGGAATRRKAGAAAAPRKRRSRGGGATRRKAGAAAAPRRVERTSFPAVSSEDESRRRRGCRADSPRPSRERRRTRRRRGACARSSTSGSSAPARRMCSP